MVILCRSGMRSGGRAIIPVRLKPRQEASHMSSAGQQEKPSTASTTHLVAEDCDCGLGDHGAK